jgi:hypothetical protein
MDEFKNKNGNDTNGETEFSVSPQFGKDLQALLSPKAAVPSEIDRRIGSLARYYFARRRVWRWVRYPAAAAAAVAAVWVCAAIWDRPGVLDSARLMTAQLSIQDIDGNGVVDIRDALCLARKVDSHVELERRWDINHDGIINRADADSVAMVAVNLSRQGLL